MESNQFIINKLEVNTVKELMTGNEAVARGMYEAGGAFASAYPGTPSTEILENIVKYKDSIYCEWAPNEKVALEAALGAAIAGGRSMATMKHVGVNVAADPLFTFAYTGTNGGCVIVSADDPGMHSSQNEQDNRAYGAFAKLPILEPANSQEAKDFTVLAFELSEKFDTPVLLRLTTRVCHGKSIVELGPVQETVIKPYEKNIAKYIATPANGKVMRVELEKRLARLKEFSETTEINQVEMEETPLFEGNPVPSQGIGVVTSGIAYQYAKEVFKDEASYLKIGMSHPLPLDKIKAFAKTVKTLYVVEELEPFMENQLKAEGIVCIGKEKIPAIGELSPDVVRKGIYGYKKEFNQPEAPVPNRPPTMCAGCPHRGLFYVLSKRKDIMVTGDIGCYTLGSAPPLQAMDTCICMGASISSGHGANTIFKKAGSKMKTVAVIGDSTFFHSGITSLMDIVYNRGNCVSIILDNRTTGMTGHQENPGTGFTLMGEEAPMVDIPELCKAVGIKEENLYVINPLDLKETSEALEKCLASEEATVIVTRWPCILKRFSEADKKEFDLEGKPCEVDQDKCTACKLCLKTGCPAIRFDEKAHIDEAMCTSCQVCVQVCPFDAIK